MTWMVGFLVINYPVLCLCFNSLLNIHMPRTEVCACITTNGQTSSSLWSLSGKSNSSGSGPSMRQLGNQPLLILSPAFLPCISAISAQIFAFILPERCTGSKRFYTFTQMWSYRGSAFLCFCSVHHLSLPSTPYHLFNPPTIPGLYSVVTSLVTTNLP